MSARFYELLEAKLNSSLKKNLPKNVSKESLSVVRDGIFNDIDSTFNHQKNRLSVDACWWLTDMYFKSIKINEKYHVSDQVVIHERTMSDLTFNDVILLSSLYDDHPFGEQLVEERKRRSAS